MATNDTNNGGAPVKKIKLRLDNAVPSNRFPPDTLIPKTDGTNGEVTVLYEDNRIIVAVKPQNVPTQADDSGDRDFLTMLKDYIKVKYNKPGNVYLGMVQRLDRPTGGVMVFARNSKAAADLCKQIKENDEFEKMYLAVVNGVPTRTGSIKHYLIKDEKTNTVSVVPSSLEGAKFAESDIKILESSGGLSLVSVNLITGRAHQARVQLKALGTPILGDVKYAGSKLVKSPHLALWAYRLTLIHPDTKQRMQFLAMPPDEFPWNRFDTERLIEVVKPHNGGHYTK